MGAITGYDRTSAGRRRPNGTLVLAARLLPLLVTPRTAPFLALACDVASFLVVCALVLLEKLGLAQDLGRYVEVDRRGGRHMVRRYVITEAGRELIQPLDPISPEALRLDLRKALRRQRAGKD